MIAAVFTCKNEADIVEVSFRHMLDQGVDRIYTTDGMSTDGTAEILHELSHELPITIVTDEAPFQLQRQWMDVLAEIAALNGAEWIIASDVDEFWYSASSETIAETLGYCQDDKLYARSYQHLDWDTRQVDHKPLPKVAYRWREGAHLSPGNHDVTIPGGRYGVLDLRELQYRGFDHYCAKIAARNQTIDPSLPEGSGWHHKRLEGKTLDELRAEYDSMCAIPTIHDPIPSRLEYR